MTHPHRSASATAAGAASQRRGATRPLGLSRRIEVCPPTLRTWPAGRWRRLLCWLLAPARRATAPSPDALGGVRSDFKAALADVAGAGAAGLRRRVALSASLRELWHLRADVFHIVGLAHGQQAAAQRLALLNRHFPGRSPLSPRTPLSPRSQPGWP